MRSLFAPLRAAWDMNYPFVQRIYCVHSLPVGHLASSLTRPVRERERGRSEVTFVMVYCYNCSISLLIVNLLLRLIDRLKCITGTCVEEEDTLALGFHAPRGFGRPSTGGLGMGSPRGYVGMAMRVLSPF